MMRLVVDALDMYSRPTVKHFLGQKQFTTDASLDALQPRRVWMSTSDHRALSAALDFHILHNPSTATCLI
jgi:hypothetical protein